MGSRTKGNVAGTWQKTLCCPLISGFLDLDRTEADIDRSHVE